MVKKSNKKSKEKPSNERLELVLPRDVSFALISLLQGRDGMIIPNDSVKLLEKDSDEFNLFMSGVERNLTNLKITEQIFENVKSLSKSIASGEIHDIKFQYKLDDYFSISFKSVILLTGIDYWDIIWKGFAFYYNDTEVHGRYNEYYTICNKIHFMTKVRGSKYNINDITMDDINNYTLQC